jgi:hypothetical protein
MPTVYQAVFGNRGNVVRAGAADPMYFGVGAVPGEQLVLIVDNEVVHDAGRLQYVFLRDFAPPLPDEFLQSCVTAKPRSNFGA